MIAPHPLIEHAKKAIARNRIRKANRLAFLCWSVPSGPIYADQVEQMNEAGWRQLTEAINAATGGNYGIPSYETRRMVVQKLREMERGERRVA